jgi:hypothetical protein
MKLQLVGSLCALGCAAALTPICPVLGQAVGAAQPSWQPYRDTGSYTSLAADGDLATAVAGGTVPDTPAGREQSPIQPAQFATDAGVMFPQPVFAGPPCEMPCYVDPNAAQLIGVPPAAFAGVAAARPSDPAFWYWRVLPEGVVWQSYWAGAHEPRLAGIVYNEDSVSFVDAALGGRASLFRYGTEGLGRPQGFELQVEGAAFPRLNLDEDWDLDATDYRVGFPLVYGREAWQAKFSYYHLSSHLGDEFIIRQGTTADRINYSRDALTLALSYFPHPAWRLYAEAGWAFYYRVSEPWEFQFGVDVAEPGPTGPWGTPFIAVNGHLREEVDYSGNVAFQAGWLWRGNSTRTLRTGFHYYNGKSSQFEFFDQFEEQIGAGLWYDF